MPKIQLSKRNFAETSGKARNYKTVKGRQICTLGPSYENYSFDVTYVIFKNKPTEHLVTENGKVAVFGNHYSSIHKIVALQTL